ncbi:MAG: radical SAM protein [Candidatus Bathyarchaeota archaeon]|nr:radical SAM protein [Candidatus Bathyarchaeota archaeon]
MVAVTKFDERHCHKWALLLRERRLKLDRILTALAAEDLDVAKRLFSEVFYGVSAGDRSDPGMAGSLLYHMAMVTKMETETNLLINEFHACLPDVDEELRFYGDFLSDAAALTKATVPLKFNTSKVVANGSLSAEEKIRLFTSLKEKTKTLEKTLSAGNPNVVGRLESLFLDWSQHIAEMRLRQEYETIKGFLFMAELAKSIGVPRLKAFMNNVQDKFGEETVRIALDVTLKVGMRREKLQSIMLSDHFINYTMSVAKLDGRMLFLNCPIFGSHQYMTAHLGVSDEVSALFCTYFCYAHAKAMLNTVLPFTFTLWQPKRIATHGECEFYLKLAHSPTAQPANFVPLVLSWNVTRKCNLKCPHCYINATTQELQNELSTEEAKSLMDQIAEVSRPLLILSGGEPLLRTDIFELVRYGAGKGFKMGLGSNGTLIDGKVAKGLKEAGITTVSVSLDSSIPEKHDEFRNMKGSWEKAVGAIKALKENNVLVQVNTTVTQQNYGEIDDIMTLAESLGVENFHLFFLVPTGRGVKIADISPAKYEHMIWTVFAKAAKRKLNVRPSCAPQFMRIAKDVGLDMRQWIRGCIAGLYYCRVYPNGDITPCPYLPVKLGNIREKAFKEIWFNSEVFKTMRNFDALKGKCGVCEHRSICGGCRARAYGLSSDFIDYCGDLHEPGELNGDYLAEDPWCVYQPKASSQ